MEPEQAKKIEEAAANVARHYPVHVTQKTWDWGMLMIALGSIEGEKLAAIYSRKKQQEAAAAPAPVAPAFANPATAPAPAMPPMPGMQTPSQMDPGAMLASQVISGNA